MPEPFEVPYLEEQARGVAPLLFSEGCRFCLEAPTADGPPFGAEAELMAKAAEPVLRLFAAGRRAAHRALVSLDLDDGPILRAEDRRPLWPKAAVGSITHTHGLAAAVAARSEHIAALGLDVELLSRQLNPDLASKVCSPRERADLDRQSAPGSPLLRLLSAKEAIFKCCYPIAGVYLGFLDAECRLIPSGYEVELLKPIGCNIPVAFELRVLQTVAFGYLFSACELSRSDLPSC